MSDHKSEFMVRFVGLMPEAEARELVESLGGTVRRRMRWDPQEQVLLIVRGMPSLEDKLRAHPKVEHLERNADDYSAL